MRSIRQRWCPRSSFVLLFHFVLACLRSPGSLLVKAQSLTVQRCTIYLAVSDLSRDNFLNRQPEYVRFVSSLSGTSYSSFASLPAPYQTLYENNSGSTSNGEIDVTGARPGTTGDAAQMAFLQNFCNKAIAIADGGGATPATPAPGPGPVPVPVPVTSAPGPVPGATTTTTTAPAPAPAANINVPFPTCRIDLAVSDSNRDAVLSETEYVTFLNRMTRGNPHFSTFAALPAPVAQIFTSPGIDITGANPATFASATADQKASLQTLCTNVQSALNGGGGGSGGTTSTPGPGSAVTGAPAPAPGPSSGTLPPGLTLLPLNQCLARMFVSDSNRDSLQSKEEYTTFVDRLTTANKYTSFDTLPAGLQNNFNDLAGDSGQINIFGATPAQQANAQQNAFLKKVCTDTQVAIFSAASESKPPTAAPVSVPATQPPSIPTQSSLPTLRPTVALDTCYQDIMVSDTTQDDYLTPVEYVTLLNQLSNNQFAILTYSELEPVLTENFDRLAAVNLSSSGREHRENAIDVYGARPSETNTTTDEEKKHLETVCLNTTYAIQDAIRSLSSVPSVAPTVAHGPTVSPGPTQGPTVFTGTIRIYSSFIIYNTLGFIASSFHDPTSALRVDLREAYTAMAKDIIGNHTWPPANAGNESSANATAGEGISNSTLPDSTESPGGSSPSPSTTSPGSVATDASLAPATPAVPFARCRIFMSVADTNRDNQLTSTEYVNFINRLTHNAYLNVPFTGLPSVLQTNFNTLASSGNINISGAPPAQFTTATSDRIAALQQICDSTQAITSGSGATTRRRIQKRSLRGLLLRNYPEDRRRLVTYDIGSATIFDVEDQTCPPGVKEAVNTSSVDCQTVYASYAIRNVVQENQTDIKDYYLGLTQAAIADGHLQNYVEQKYSQVGKGVVVYGNTDKLIIWTTPPTSAPTTDQGNGGGGGGGPNTTVIGVVVIGILGLCALGGYFAWTEKTTIAAKWKEFQKKDKKKKNTGEDGEDDEIDPEEMEMLEGEEGEYVEYEVGEDGEIIYHDEEYDEELLVEEEEEEDFRDEESEVEGMLTIKKINAKKLLGTIGKVGGKISKHARLLSEFGTDMDIEEEIELGLQDENLLDFEDYIFDTPAELLVQENGEAGNKLGDSWDPKLSARRGSAKSGAAVSASVTSGIVSGATDPTGSSDSDSNSDGTGEEFDDEYEEESDSDEDDESQQDASFGLEFSESGAPQHGEEDTISSKMDDFKDEKNDDDSLSSADEQPIGASVMTGGEGIESMLAAAKLKKDGDDDSDSLDRDLDNNNRENGDDDDIHISDSDEGEGSSYASGSTTSSTEQRQEEYRSEVQQLVEKVIPDEMDNLSTMMDQFEGREAELINTLQNMEERTSTQRARAAIHKTKIKVNPNAVGGYSIASEGSAVIAAASTLGPEPQRRQPRVQPRDEFSDDYSGSYYSDEFSGSYTDNGSRSYYSDEYSGSGSYDEGTYGDGTYDDDEEGSYDEDEEGTYEESRASFGESRASQSMDQSYGSQSYFSDDGQSFQPSLPRVEEDEDGGSEYSGSYYSGEEEEGEEEERSYVSGEEEGSLIEGDEEGSYVEEGSVYSDEGSYVSGEEEEDLPPNKGDEYYDDEEGSFDDEEEEDYSGSYEDED